MLIFNSSEPTKDINFQKQANQSILNGAIVISTIIFMKARKNIVLLIKREPFERRKNLV